MLDRFTKKSAKLLPCQLEMLHWWDKRGLPHTQIAKMFRVTPRLVAYYVKKEKNNFKANLEARGGSKIYYDREKNTLRHRKYRSRLKEMKNETVVA